MLSYRHQFHAGNHADVLKHVVLGELLRYLAAKDKPFWYIDTHAGRGCYELGGHAAAEELAQGIGRLWGRADLSPALSRYLELVRRANAGDELRRYPGSPWIAAALARDIDRLWFSELHPADYGALAAQFGQRDRRVRVERRDGLDWLHALLPPAPRRALVMTDPSYEVKAEYGAVVDAVALAIERFPTGVYAVWYPHLQRREARDLPAAMQRVAGRRWLQASLTVRHPGQGGMHGSGLFIANPPHTLPVALAETLPQLAELLAQDAGAGYTVDFRLP